MDLDRATIQELRAGSDFVGIVRQAMPIRRVGLLFRGRCPFCDKTGFRVDSVKKLFYCFDCGKGGDVFKFVSAVNRISFQQAVEYVAALLPGAKTN